MGDGDEEGHLDLDDASGMLRRIEGSLSARLLRSGDDDDDDDDDDVRKWNLMRELPQYARDRLEFLKEFKSKLHNLEDAAQNVVLENFSPNIRKRVESLKEIQSQHDQLETKFFEERDALVAKYQKLYEPLYMKRFEVVNGVVEVEGFCDEVTAKTTKDKGKGVPEFWLTAMRTNEVLAEEITERDVGALKYLIDIKWCRICNPKGFKLEFLFDSNPYFKNSVLTKTYHVVDKYDPILEKAIGMEIEWFPCKNLTQKLLVKKSKKGSKNRKPITRVEDCRSFFNFFNPPRIPGYDEYLSNAAAEQLQKQLEQDYEIGSTIRDEIIPHAVLWFTGEAVLDKEVVENEVEGTKEGEEDADDEHEE